MSLKGKGNGCTILDLFCPTSNGYELLNLSLFLQGNDTFYIFYVSSFSHL